MREREIDPKLRLNCSLKCSLFRSKSEQIREHFISLFSISLWGRWSLNQHFFVQHQPVGPTVGGGGPLGSGPVGSGVGSGVGVGETWKVQSLFGVR